MFFGQKFKYMFKNRRSALIKRTERRLYRIRYLSASDFDGLEAYPHTGQLLHDGIIILLPVPAL